MACHHRAHTGAGGNAAELSSVPVQRSALAQRTVLAQSPVVAVLSSGGTRCGNDIVLTLYVAVRRFGKDARRPLTPWLTGRRPPLGPGRRAGRPGEQGGNKPMEVLEHVTGIVVDHCLAGPGGVTSGGWRQIPCRAVWRGRRVVIRNGEPISTASESTWVVAARSDRHAGRNVGMRSACRASACGQRTRP
jgi:hypothetical protein